MSVYTGERGIYDRAVQLFVDADDIRLHYLEWDPQQIRKTGTQTRKGGL